MSINEIVNLAIQWVPTILFFLIVFISALTGLRRGLRKSTISLIHCLIAFIIAGTIFVIFVFTSFGDKTIVNIANTIIGSEAGLQNMLNVDTSCTTLREIILDYILSLLATDNTVSGIVQNNEAYILTLVDLIYRLVFFLIAEIIYLIIRFILFIISCIFYSEKKHRRKLDKGVLHGTAEHTYKKRRLAGSLVGACKGILTAILFLSSLGGILFIATGGSGEEKMDDIEFGNSDINMVYDIYNSVGQYGEYGIYKVLNVFKDNNNTPYYLYAFDLLFSGGLEDGDIDETILFRDEFASIIDFGKDILEVVAYHNGGDLSMLLNNPTTDDILVLLQDEAFQKDFEKLIDDFNTPTYLSNFTFSLAESVIATLSSSNSTNISKELADILSILFTDGYLSENIPYEKQLLDEKNKSENPDDNKYKLDNLKISNIITKHNVKVIYKIFLDVMEYNEISTSNELNTKDTINIVQKIVNHVFELSLFNPEYSEQFNGIYKRLFAYLDANILNTSSENQMVYAVSEQIYINDEFDNVDWVREIHELGDIVNNVITLYFNLFEGENIDYLDAVFSIYDKTDPNYTQNVFSFENILHNISKSHILSIVLSSKLVISPLIDTLENSIEGYQFPTNITFTNSYDASGNIINYGEFHYIFESIKIILSNTEITNIIKDLINEDIELSLEDLNNIIDQLVDGENSLINTLLNSEIVCSAISGFILSDYTTNLGFEIYIHESLLELGEDGTKINIIKNNELKLFFEKISLLFEMIYPMLEGDIDIELISELLLDPRLTEILDSKIIEGTISKLIVNNLSEIEMLVIPQAMIDGKYLITTAYEKSEIRVLIEVVQNTGIDLSKLLGDTEEMTQLSEESDPTTAIIDIIKELNEEDIELLFDSKILHYTVSNFLETNVNDLVNGLTVIIPLSAKSKLNNETIEYLINKDLLVDFFVNIIDLLPTDGEFDVNDILKKIVSNKDTYLSNPIIAPTLVNFLVNSNEFDALFIPDVLKDDASIEKLQVYSTTNIWRVEIINILNVFDELFGISEGNEINFESDILNDQFQTILSDYNKPSNVNPDLTKLELLYESLIAAGNITKVLYDNVLTDTNNIIDSSLKYDSRIYNSKYQMINKSEISALINATQVLGLDLNQENLDPKLYISNLRELSKDERFELYDSYLLMGILTKAIDTIIDNSNGSLVHVQAAYQTDINIYKNNEIDAILELLTGDLLTDVIDGTGDLNINSFNMHDLRDIVYIEQSHETRSYLILAAISNIIKDVDGIFIPASEYTKDKYYDEYIKTESFVELIDAIEALGFTTLNINLENFEFPHGDELEVVSESEIIRATITKMLKVNNESGSSFKLSIIDDDKYRVDTVDFRGNSLIYFSKQEFINLFEAISELLGDQKAYEFEFNYGILLRIALDSSLRNTLLKSNVFHMIVNSVLVEGDYLFTYQLLGVTNINYYNCYDLSTETRYNYKVGTEHQLHAALDKLMIFG